MLNFDPLFLKSTTLVTRFIDLENTSLFLIMVIGGAGLGLSNGLVRKSGFSPGGFCVIYDAMKKYFYVGIGTSTLVVNIVLISLYFLYIGLYLYEKSLIRNSK